jgi:hypothetical protein
MVLRDLRGDRSAEHAVCGNENDQAWHLVRAADKLFRREMSSENAARPPILMVGGDNHPNTKVRTQTADY